MNVEYTQKESHNNIPDAKARFSGLSMFKFSLPLDEDLLDGVCILYLKENVLFNCD